MTLVGMVFLAVSLAGAAGAPRGTRAAAFMKP